MQLKAKFFKYYLNFNFIARTSKLVLNNKLSYFLQVKDLTTNKIGVGEVSVIRGLTPDSEIESKLNYLCNNINDSQEVINSVNFAYNNSIAFGLATALKELNAKEQKILFPSKFSENKDEIETNGLIWINNKTEVIKQIDEKINIFNCLKLKVGFDLSAELEMIKYIRQQSADKVIRLDANGAYNLEQAKYSLDKFAKYNIHSIEQPLDINNWQQYTKLIENSPINIALDEELTRLNISQLKQLLTTFCPKYFVLKPSMLGDFNKIEKIIKLAQQNNIGWWMSSALESNIGLNSIAQFCYKMMQKYNNKLVQGLGTGGLYNNNVSSPLELKGMHLVYKYGETDWQNMNFFK